ncbi:isocitrate lyase/phosphoenolpyruvate mutase family protein [Vibrio mimicus]|nr:isocitrate lyase/phosphoenolpyruvate mutase family protein [Vibrio cholerae]ELY5268591.1 isocitrate lyase/phosphoenolpyruvate mutase family protein [Vibrio cholerae]EMC9265732.1 isocitrate lyase/phosphoenolpyruvate mutase family protein [Vibrio cholerae]EMC9387939.1 isocitrate lyase/phosphoenolpyruvate mutase family protein [Vibrio cholerae]HAS6350126.1 isocitrate lyase/phosphoenolpyruvate mutase family protein [Vibrio vulnificus]
MFKNMHKMEDPLVICNVWDVPSAKIAERVGFLAIGTSSAAIANNLGKEDGENINFEELLVIVKAIVKSTNLPLTVDIESGYGNTPEIIAKNIIELVKVGVVGINIEDSVVVDGKRRLRDGILFEKMLRKVRELLSEADVEVFINVRSDAFLLNVKNPLVVSIERINRYQQAGADGIFLPCIRKTDDIESVVAITSLPINVMCVPELPSFSELKALGVKRISMGNFVHEAMLVSLSSYLMSIKNEQSFQALFI